MEKQTSRIFEGGRIGVDPGIFFARSLSRTQEHHGVKKCGHVCLGMTAAQNILLHQCWTLAVSSFPWRVICWELADVYKKQRSQISDSWKNPTMTSPGIKVRLKPV